VSSRSYLSIGDVLTLLREEFPDVTISKIRFLESQGLVNPERSPSGYRKFFDHDVERLRWVLRQQREHFLPLKVIRDRLADGDLDDAGEALNGKAGSTHAPEPVHATASGGGASGAPGGHASAPAASVSASAASPPPSAAEQPTKADEEAMARILADASRRTARLPEDGPGRRGLQVVGDTGAPGTTAATSSATAHAAATTAAASTSAAGATDTRAEAGRSERTASHPSGAATGRSGASSGGSGNGAASRESATAETSRSASGGGPRGSGGGQGGSRKSPAHAAGAPPAAEAPTVAATGASLTAEELSAASGLAVEEVAGLVSFGLIEPVSVAGIETYDEDAVTLANLAASFRAFGIEPRHLRLYRNAVDREIGLIEQVVIPLLRQRNPESRQRALDAADELGALGQSMRATLLKQALRRHLGG
jgi:DNA-binding transcriptional MerR regulator